MPWPIRLIEDRDRTREQLGYVPVGACWEAPWMVTNRRDPQARREFLSPRYWRDHAALRAPLIVKLPDGSEFCVDSRAWSPEQGLHGEGWEVSGAPPRLTLSPSINIVGSYHGWIRDGEISDDCEGRSYPFARGFPDSAPIRRRDPVDPVSALLAGEPPKGLPPLYLPPAP